MHETFNYFTFLLSMGKRPEIDIIGAGRVARSLAPALDNAGFQINNIYSRNTKNAKKLASLLYEAQTIQSLDFSGSSSSIFILTVADDAIEDICKEIVIPEDAILVHTSGSTPMSTLGYSGTPNIGVLYPLQTFSLEKAVAMDLVPFLIEGDNTYTRNIIKAVAEKIGDKVTEASSKQRAMVHLAAVFACNFTNHMMTEASDLLSKNGLVLELLSPLIVETINKSLSIGPQKGQTGPAARGDLSILEKHMALLENDEERQELYRHVSQRILDRYS